MCQAHAIQWATITVKKRNFARVNRLRGRGTPRHGQTERGHYFQVGWHSAVGVCTHAAREAVYRIEFTVRVRVDL